MKKLLSIFLSLTIISMTLALFPNIEIKAAESNYSMRVCGEAHELK